MDTLTKFLSMRVRMIYAGPANEHQATLIDYRSPRMWSRMGAFLE